MAQPVRHQDATMTPYCHIRLCEALWGSTLVGPAFYSCRSHSWMKSIRHTSLAKHTMLVSASQHAAGFCSSRNAPLLEKKKVIHILDLFFISGDSQWPYEGLTEVWSLFSSQCETETTSSFIQHLSSSSMCCHMLINLSVQQVITLGSNVRQEPPASRERESWRGRDAYVYYIKNYWRSGNLQGNTLHDISIIVTGNCPVLQPP